MEYNEFFINNTKIALLLRQQRIPFGQSIPVYPDGQYHNKGDDAGGNYTSVRISPAQDCTEETDIGLPTNFDMDVADAIYTIWWNVRGHKNSGDSSPLEFTTRQVSRVLTGNFKQDLTQKREAEIDASIEHLKKIRIAITCIEEMAFYEKNFAGFNDLPFLVCEEEPVASEESAAEASLKVTDRKRKPYGKKYVISCPRAELISEGRILHNHFLPLYYYAEQNRHIISFRPELLGYWKGKDQIGISNTIENIQLKRYLIRRIHSERNYLKREKTKPSPKKQSGRGKKQREFHSDSVYVFKIIYIRKLHRSHPKNHPGTAGAMQELCISEDRYASKSSWLREKNIFHRNVVKILTYFTGKYVDYIVDFEPVLSKENDGSKPSVVGVSISVISF